ncbi:glycosyl hydrolase family 28-related protein [Leifsonia sp. AG29]|uniref:glycosyl hydrolase family 28-related protein n=1 Tax=Leifsonia sp. AG29 TaxID=2598860 RepID=UPI00131BEA8A|nr:glycosyl hydrolase family 28-related protein [Leifsonia sp. AG29]
MPYTKSGPFNLGLPPALNPDHLNNMETQYSSAMSDTAALYGLDVRPWAPSTQYTAGQMVISPFSGAIVKAKTTHTSGSTFSGCGTSGNWTSTATNIDVRDYGAKLDGATDDSGAVQAAANANPGRVITVPAGVSVWASGVTLGHGQTLRGAGQQDWRDRTGAFGDSNYANNANYNGTVIRFSGTTGTAITILDTEVNSGGVEDFTLIGPGSGTSTGIAVGSSSMSVVNLKVSRVKVANFYLGVWTQNVNEATFTALMIRGCSTGINLDTATNNNAFTMLDIERCGNGVIIGSTSWANSFYSLIAQSCSGIGVQVSGQLNAFYNPYFEANTGGCFNVLSGARGTVLDAPMYGGSSGALANAVTIASGALYTALRSHSSNPAAIITNAGTGTRVDGAMGTGQLVDSGTGTILIDSATAGSAFGTSLAISNPTVTGFTVGNGSVLAKYNKVGKRLFCEIKITLGSTSAITGAISVATGLTLFNARIPANAIMVNSTSGATYQGMAHVTSAGLVTIGVMSLTDRSIQALSSTVPFAMSTNDWIAVSFTADTP